MVRALSDTSARIRPVKQMPRTPVFAQVSSAMDGRATIGGKVSYGRGAMRFEYGSAYDDDAANEGAPPRRSRRNDAGT